MIKVSAEFAASAAPAISQRQPEAPAEPMEEDDEAKKLIQQKERELLEANEKLSKQQREIAAGKASNSELMKQIKSLQEAMAKERAKAKEIV